MIQINRFTESDEFSGMTSPFFRIVILCVPKFSLLISYRAHIMLVRLAATPIEFPTYAFVAPLALWLCSTHNK